MTSREIDIAIAKACGWVSIVLPEEMDPPEPECMRPIGRIGFGREYLPIPAYSSDLNATAEAESKLIYVDDEIDTDLISDYLLNLVISSKAGRSQSATAAERSKAIFLTIGRRKEGDHE